MAAARCMDGRWQCARGANESRRSTSAVIGGWTSGGINAATGSPKAKERRERCADRERRGGLVVAHTRDSKQ